MTDYPSFTIEDALQIRRLAERSPIRFSCGGRWIAYCLDRFTGEEGSALEVWVTEVDTGLARQVMPEARAAWGVSWSPVAAMLACYADTGEGLQLWAWEAETGQARRVSPAIIVADFNFEVPQWTPDGTAVVVKLADAERLAYYDPSGKEIRKPPAPRPRADQATVRVWTSQSQADEQNQPRGGWRGGALARVEVATGAMTPLVVEPLTWGWAVSPDGQWVAFTHHAGRDVGGVSSGDDLCLVPSTGGEVRTLVPYTRMNYGLCFSWAPDASAVAFWDNGNVFVTDLAGERRQLTHFGAEDREEFYEQPLWSPDGSFLIVNLLGTTWRLPRDGGDPIDLLPEREGLFVAREFSPGGGPCFWSPDGRSVPVYLVRGDECGFGLVSTEGDGLLGMHLRAGHIGDIQRFDVDVSPARGLLSFAYENADQPPDVWVMEATISEPRQLTRINPHLQGQEWPAPQVLNWPDAEAGPHRLVFYPPPTRFGPPPYPTIFTIYEGGLAWRNEIFGFDASACDNIHIYTHHGYAVCGPDLPMSDEKGPARSVREALPQAVKALVEAGLADPRRLGLIGHSYGGYTVNCAITGLDCFAAAISDTGAVNLTSGYGRVNEEGASFCGYFEQGQGKMGAPPWAAAEKYIENSPLFQLDRVTTPLLIIHGARDTNLTQAWELFVGLRRLGKVAELAIYQGEEHWQGTWSRANIIDRWHRVLAWCDRHLMP